jgi:hypothetical protein
MCRFAHQFFDACVTLVSVLTPTPATIVDLTPDLFTGPVNIRFLDRERPHPPAVGWLRQALEVVVDLGTLVLMSWLIPFVILAIGSPIVLILWGALAVIRWL